MKEKKSSGVKKPSVTSLVKKLDKVFGEFIRLRDSREFGYKAFRCISCGRILPYDQMDCGHFIGRMHMATRFDEQNCHGECRACLTPDALVLMADLRWIPLGDVNEGDELVGFTEISRGRGRRWEKCIVTHIHRKVAQVYDVELENGDHIKTTADHKWLCHTREGDYRWVETQEMHETTVCKPFIVHHQDKSFGINKTVRSKYDTKVKSITPIGMQGIVVMETSTHTFIANGYMMHNCNRFSPDHMIYYQRNLERKIGKDKLELLIARGHQTKKWTSWELEILISHYTEEVKKMKAV